MQFKCTLADILKLAVETVHCLAPPANALNFEPRSIARVAVQAKRDRVVVRVATNPHHAKFQICSQSNGRHPLAKNQQPHVVRRLLGSVR